MNLNYFKGISHLEKLFFTRHLAVMLKSGISLGEAISLLSSQATNERFKKVIVFIQKDIDNGKSLHQALANHGNVFDAFYVRLIAVGEDSGNLQRNLEYLSAQLRKQYDFEKKVKGALMYPAVIVITALIAGAGIGLFVLPKLTELFASLDIALPWSTKLLLFTAGLMKEWGIIIILGIFIIFFLIARLLQTKTVKPFFHYFLLRSPIFGPFFRNVELALFCRNLGVMLQSGLPLVSAFESQMQATSNIVFQRYVRDLYINSQKGKTLESIMKSSASPFIPQIAVKMIGVGEKTGKLDESLLYLGDFFEEEVDDATRNFTTLLEPLVLLAVGLAVAFLAYAIIAPVYQFTGSIHR